MDYTLDALLAAQTTSVFEQLMGEVNPHQIFRASRQGFQLLDTSGADVIGAVWEEKPEPLSYLFLPVYKNNQVDLYTILGQHVLTLQRCSWFSLLHFCIVFIQDNTLYFGRLRQEGIGFVLETPLPIGDYGYLGAEKVILRDALKSGWHQYAYTDTLHYVSEVPVLTDLTPEKIPQLLSLGMSASFLSYNATQIGLPASMHPTALLEHNTWLEANRREKLMFQQFAQLTPQYSLTELATILGAPLTTLYVLEYYRTLKDIQEL